MVRDGVSLLGGDTFADAYHVSQAARQVLRSSALDGQGSWSGRETTIEGAIRLGADRRGGDTSAPRSSASVNVC